MEELLKYLKEFLFKFFKNKQLIAIIYSILIFIIIFNIPIINIFLEGFNTLNSNTILNFYNLTEEIVGIKHLEIWQFLFVVGLILFFLIF